MNISANNTWKSFKEFIDTQVAGNHKLLYRGQANDKWGLVSSYHRLQAAHDPSLYWQILNTVHDYVVTWSDQRWSLDDERDLAAFLGFIQHNGFPTPLLDWTRSPYTAAYFAFSAVNDAAPESENVAIFAFNDRLWTQHWKPVYDVRDTTPHVSVLLSESRGNRRQLLQQGAYTFSTAVDQERHIFLHARTRNATAEVPNPYLYKITISVQEKPLVVRDLALMGITPMTLFPGIEGVCKHLRDTLFPAAQVGLTPSQRASAILESLKTFNRGRPTEPPEPLAEPQAPDR